MYVRPQGFRYPEGVRLPGNYSGNTFREIAEEPPAENMTASGDSAELSASSQVDTDAESAALLTKKETSPSPFGLKGIGTEELLLFALILLLSDSELGDDLVLFLILLFFIK